MRSAAAAARSHVHAGVPQAQGGAAVYTLADPRDLQAPRYVGQTRDPHARFAQHVRTARLWLPDEPPWWVRSPKHRPLYAWIRELHRDGGWLPFMWVEQWVGPGADPRVAERAAIMRWLARGAQLLNVEARGPQLPLL
ncbi:MAG TPA: GIY-YIG nuclease family protein [Gammaproteobacteria bacterium]|nr:GIY-YIG nuclease family protein [Gammaproteobacteria bacterium]